MIVSTSCELLTFKTAMLSSPSISILLKISLACMKDPDNFCQKALLELKDDKYSIQEESPSLVVFLSR